jgi:hypothetical protein
MPAILHGNCGTLYEEPCVVYIKVGAGWRWLVGGAGLLLDLGGPLLVVPRLGTGQGRR